MQKIDFGNGKIEYNEFHIDINKSLEDQIWELNEDLLQVKYYDKYGNIYVLDVGWYPEFNLSGEFKIIIVKNFDWSNPILLKKSGINDFYKTLNECIYNVNNL